jgi:methyl-accepting chemotaxis protein
MRNSLSIKSKLFIGVGVMIIVSVVVALTSLYSISLLSSNIGNVVGTRMPQSKRVADITEAIETSALHIDEAALADNQATVQKELEYTSSNRKATNENMKQLKESMASEEEKSLFQTVLDARASYMKSRDALIELVREGRKEEAHQALESVKPLRAAFLKALKDLDAHVQAQSKNASSTADRNAKMAKVIVLSLLGATLLIAAVVLLAVVSSITVPLRKAIETANRIAERDLTVVIDSTDSTETGQLMAAMRNMVEHLREMIEKTVKISNGIAAASNQLHSASTNIATGAEEVASQTNTVATASEEMSHTSTDIARNCSMAADASKLTTASATAGAKVVSETITGMNVIAERVRRSAGTVEALGARSEQIGAIIGTIEDIADQTNLLALNAAIEAARAGDQGRGFAVVADEVRALAERTTKATREIGEMIKAIQHETSEAVHAMDEGVAEVEKGTASSQKSGAALEEILDRINEVAMQINQIATASEEQTATTGEVTSNIVKITDVMQEIARGADGSAAAAAELSRNAKDLQNLVGQFRVA